MEINSLGMLPARNPDFQWNSLYSGPHKYTMVRGHNPHRRNPSPHWMGYVTLEGKIIPSSCTERAVHGRTGCLSS